MRNQPRSPAPAPASKRWTCKGCGAINKVTSGSCVLCGDFAPPIPVPAQAIPIPTNLWTCKKCGCYNHIGHITCIMCLSKRVPPAPPAAPPPAAKPVVSEYWCKKCELITDGSLNCLRCGTRREDGTWATPPAPPRIAYGIFDKITGTQDGEAVKGDDGKYVATLNGKHLGIVSDLRVLDCYYSYNWIKIS